jgi:hypothetical protein
MQLAQQLATGWMVQELNPRGSESFRAPVQTDPGTQSASCTMDTVSFPWVWHRPPTPYQELT